MGQQDPTSASFFPHIPPPVLPLGEQAAMQGKNPVPPPPPLHPASWLCLMMRPGPSQQREADSFRVLLRPSPAQQRVQAQEGGWAGVEGLLFLVSGMVVSYLDRQSTHCPR